MIVLIVTVASVWTLFALTLLLWRIERRLGEAAKDRTEFAKAANSIAARFQEVQRRIEDGRPPPRAQLRCVSGAHLVPTTNLDFASGEQIVAPNEVRNIVVCPLRSNYMIPAGVVIEAWAHKWPAIEQRATVLEVEINQFPQLPHAGEFFSDTFWAPPGYAIPCSWGIFSINALMHALVIVVRNDNGVSIGVRAKVYGESIDHLPKNWIAAETASNREQRLRTMQTDRQRFEADCARLGMKPITVGDAVTIEGFEGAHEVLDIDYSELTATLGTPVGQFRNVSLGDLKLFLAHKADEDS